jgi:hypothetical protein
MLSPSAHVEIVFKKEEVFVQSSNTSLIGTLYHSWFDSLPVRTYNLRTPKDLLLIDIDQKVYIWH